MILPSTVKFNMDNFKAGGEMLRVANGVTKTKVGDVTWRDVTRSRAGEGEGEGEGENHARAFFSPHFPTTLPNHAS